MPSDWFTFVHENNSLFGGPVGATLTAILLGLKQFIGTPRLYLDFKSGQDAYLSESTHVEGEGRVTRKYLRVSVTATGIFGLRFGGSSGARKCRIYVTSIQPIKDGATQNDHIFDARPISWPPDKDFDPRDIPRASPFANVVTMKQHHLAWAFQLPDTYGLKPINHANLRHRHGRQRQTSFDIYSRIDQCRQVRV